MIEWSCSNECTQHSMMRIYGVYLIASPIPELQLQLQLHPRIDDISSHISLTSHSTHTSYIVGVTYAVKLYDTDVGALVWSQVSVQNAHHCVLLSSLSFLLFYFFSFISSVHPYLPPILYLFLYIFSLYTSSHSFITLPAHFLLCLTFDSLGLAPHRLSLFL